MQLLIFAFLAVLAVTGALLTVLHPRAVNSAMSLVMVMVALSGIYLLLNAHLGAVLQIIVYAGAIMVLILFVIMLLGEEEKGEQLNKTKILLQLGALLSVSLIFIFIAASMKAPSGPEPPVPGEANSSPVGQFRSDENKSSGSLAQKTSEESSAPGLEKKRTVEHPQSTNPRNRNNVAISPEFGTIKSVGSLLFSGYVLAFEAVSLVLLASIAGAVLLAKRRLD